ncbi:hypothetical protein [Bifidobacterium biavatii]|uniref:Uncharacterized protein n=1 Tax=Bifidobacterium biavatii DSM 23969 TaxID=1437608 RepID=A0A086ZU06_9BIFI|nr:hypothetical protein [Bifidobacterium biavatii]KFI50006.1 hypothetical protein BBIA_2139 [Bifidobacterium biavatii DSM 23969]
MGIEPLKVIDRLKGMIADQSLRIAMLEAQVEQLQAAQASPSESEADAEAADGESR